MKDPYILEDGTLKNLLNINNYQELREAEKDIGFVKLLNVEQVAQEKCDINMLKKIHRHIFEDIFEWAGEFRTVPLYKQEVVIPRISLEYGQPKDIENDLNKYLENMNNVNWQNKGIDEITKEFCSHLSKIWRVHPFRDGNTRTTLAFANIFAKQHGFEMDMSTMLDELARVVDPDTGKIIKWSIRDKFVLASLDERDYPEPQALETTIKKAINNGSKNMSFNDTIER